MIGSIPTEVGLLNVSAGIAAGWHGALGAARTVGSCSFIAPESCRHDPSNARNDVKQAR